MKTVIEMAREAGFPFNKYGLLYCNDDNEIDADAMLERFAALVRADERDDILRMSYSQWFKSQSAYDEAIKARSNT